jgi:hypothetical protein
MFMISLPDMAVNNQSMFWESIPSASRHTIQLAVPTQELKNTISVSPHPTTLAARYILLESLLQDVAAQEHQTTQRSNKPHNSSIPHVSPLFPLAMLQTETHNCTAAEQTYRTLLSTAPANLAAMSNLTHVTNLQHKHAEAHTLATELLPLFQTALGENSPQVLGYMRELTLSLVGLGRGQEARAVYQRGVVLVAGISNKELRKDEEDAMQEMGRNIDLLIYSDET